MTIQAPLNINQGELTSFSVQWVGTDMAGGTCRMKIRTAPLPGGSDLQALSAPSNGIVFSASPGQAKLDTITVTISAAMSAAWVVSSFGGAVYDVLATLADGVTAKRLIEGPVIVKAQVTV